MINNILDLSKIEAGQISYTLAPTDLRQAILASLARQGRTVRVPLNRTADLSRIIRTAETLRQELRREPTPEEIAASTGLSLDVVQSLAALNTADVRLDAPLDPDGERSLIDRFVADEQSDAEGQAMDKFLSEEIDRALRTLPPRDAKVLRLYFGLDGGREHTLEEIGQHFGLSSLATIHKHLTNLERKGMIRRKWNRSRALEVVPQQRRATAIELPLVGRVAAGVPIEPVEQQDTISVP